MSGTGHCAVLPGRALVRQRGFTLIEAIVALVLLATAGMALFAWINTNIITLARIQDLNAKNHATADALEYMNSVNPMLAPQGSETIGRYQLRWLAQETVKPRDGAAYPYGISLYQFALYQTTVTIDLPDNPNWLNFTLQQVGYKRVRDQALPR